MGMFKQVLELWVDNESGSGPAGQGLNGLTGAVLLRKRVVLQAVLHSNRMLLHCRGAVDAVMNFLFFLG